MTPRGVVRVIESRRELLDAIGTSAEAFPVPHPSWHGYVSEMRACLADLRWALAVAEAVPEVLDLVAQAVEGKPEEPFSGGGGAGPALSGAYERLGRLPVPAGEHPYLDEIVHTMEAMEAILLAISLVPAAAHSFEQLVDSAPHRDDAQAERARRRAPRTGRAGSANWRAGSRHAEDTFHLGGSVAGESAATCLRLTRGVRV